MPTDGDPVRLWMNNERLYREGERVRIQVNTDVDGFLLVLNYDAEGRVKVLFPLDPRDDSRVQAGRRYEVRDQDGSQAFIASGDGTGLIYSAVSPEPWRFEDVVVADRWDYSKLDIDARSRNPEQDLTEVVQRIAGSRGFDYDVMGYRVYAERSYTTSSGYSRGPIYVYDDALFCNNWYWRYNACRRWPYDGGWSFGTSIYLGFGNYYPYYYPYYYDPFYYGYGYRPYGYGFGYGFGGYYPYVPYYPGGRSRPRATIVGRSRGYTIQPRGNFTSWTPVAGNLTRGSGRDGGGESAAPSNNWRGRGSGGGRNDVPATGRGSSGDPPAVVAPPARRARPENVRYPAPRGGYGPSDRGSSGWEAPVRGSAREAPVRGSDREAPARGSAREAPAREERGRDFARPVRGESRGAPPPQRESSGSRGGGGGGSHGGGGAHGGGGGGGGGGHAAPSRPRRP
ncbi:MAG TPA: DUF4384 domain-containing protein [Gemmatimonadales bacterium]|jgi:hypothetical protein|nr:DUF4384 domain-containing protein [Gemmatimonadales bacterium]